MPDFISFLRKRVEPIFKKPDLDIFYILYFLGMNTIKSFKKCNYEGKETKVLVNYEWQMGWRTGHQNKKTGDMATQYV